jgi:hypothetical protein
MTSLFLFQNMATFAKENHLYNLHMISFVTENSPKKKKNIGAQNKMTNITKGLK